MDIFDFVHIDAGGNEAVRKWKQDSVSCDDRCSGSCVAKTTVSSRRKCQSQASCSGARNVIPRRHWRPALSLTKLTTRAWSYLLLGRWDQHAGHDGSSWCVVGDGGTVSISGTCVPGNSANNRFTACPAHTGNVGYSVLKQSHAAECCVNCGMHIAEGSPFAPKHPKGHQYALHWPLIPQKHYFYFHPEIALLFTKTRAALPVVSVSRSSFMWLAA